MGLTKRLYKDHEVVITAKNLNDIQDSILTLEERAGIVPGEGETTKIINVLNSVGSLTAAQAASLPDGLYWVVNPITFQNADKSQTYEVSGLAAKSGNVWQSFGNGKAGVTDDAGTLQRWYYFSLPSVGNKDEGEILAVDETGQWVPDDVVGDIGAVLDAINGEVV